MINFSCKDCTKRHMGCHSECDTYKNEVIENERQKSQRKISQEFYNYTRESMANHMNISAKKRKKQSGYEKFAGRR